MDQDMEWIIEQVNKQLGRPETVHDAVKALGEQVDIVLGVRTPPERERAALDEIRLLLAQLRRWERDQRDLVGK
jgi:hypothetical protein